MRILLFILLVGFTHPLFSQNLQWIKSFGPDISVQAEAQKIIRDNAGNIYVGGKFRGTVDFDPGAGVYELTCVGGQNAFLLKVDGTGNFIWAKSWGYAVEEVGGLEIDSSGNLYVVGAYGLTKKFAPDGSLIWSKTLPGDEAKDIKFLNNNLYITGAFSGTVNYTTASGAQSATSNGLRDIYIMKTDTSGQIKWLKAIGGYDDDRATSLQTTGNGKIAVGGKYRGTVDFDPGPGVYNLTAAGVDEAFITQLDTNGNFQWANGFIGSGNASINGIAVDNSNNVYGVGNYTGNLDLDPTAGQNLVTSAGSDDIFYLKLNTSGNVIWSKSIGGSSNDWGYQIALSLGGSLLISGQYTSANVNFDPGSSNFTHSCNGAGNVFFISADPDGHFLNAGFIEGTSLINMTQLRTLPEGGFLISGSYNYFGNGCDFDPGAGTQDLPGLGGLSRHAYIGKYNDATPLALRLLEVNVARTDKGNHVSWLPTDEVGVLQYEIEVSLNGTDFKQTGIVSAQNHTGTNRYSFMDINAAAYHQTVYYRIKMVDQNQVYTYSKTVSLPGDGRNNHAIVISPNPVHDFIVVQGSNENDKIQIRNMCGSVVAYRTPDKHTGCTVDVSKLIPGLYILSVIKPDGSIINTKFARQ